MSSSQVSTIERLLEHLATAFVQKPNRNWCAEIRLPGGEDSPWVQVTGEEINFHYPFDADPVQKLVEIGIPPLPGMVCQSWQAGTYATMELVEAGDVAWLARWIDSLFLRLYRCDSHYEPVTDLLEL